MSEPTALRTFREFSPRGDADRDGPGDHWVTISGNHVLIREPQGKQPAQKQPVAPQPFHPRTTYDKTLSAKDLAQVKEKVEAALALINSKWPQLTEEEKSLLQHIESIDVDPKAARSFVLEDKRQLTLTPNFIASASVPWLASSIAHDGYHVIQWKLGGVQNSRGMRAEVAAWKVQLEVGDKLGLNDTEKNKLKDYIQNPSQLEKYINTPPH